MSKEAKTWTAALVVIGDEILSGRTQDKNVAQVATWLNEQGIRLAEVRIIPDDIDRIGETVADAYHFTRSGFGGNAWKNVPAENIYCFQYSDVSPNPVTGVRRPTDRLAPGKGIVRWREMLGLLAQKNYTGYLSYEAPNPELWERDPVEVAREGVELTRKLLRDAVPSYA